MESRKKILDAIRKNKSNSRVNLPELFVEADRGNDLEAFCRSLEGGSAHWKEFTDYKEAAGIIQNHFSDIASCMNTINSIELKSTDLGNLHELKEINPLDMAIVRGEFGVAENGAIWLDLDTLPFRIIPFFCENLVIVLEKNEIVSDMHSAYARLSEKDYKAGSFIAGPSKTADIEQTLVVGAQGPKKLLVLLENRA